MVNHVVKDHQKLDSVLNHGIKDLEDMLEPCHDIVAFSRIAYNGLQWYSFFKDMCFAMMGKHVITMIMTMVYYVFIAPFLTMSMESKSMTMK